jgi:O-antigen/teichoic acid export membrane protein
MAEESNEIQEKKERRNIKVGIVITYLRLAIYLVISILYPPQLIAFLNKGQSYDVYGLYQFATSIATWILLISFGIENSYVRFATESEHSGGEESLKKTNGFYLIIFSFISLLELVVGLIVAFLYQANVIQIAGYDDARRNLLSILIIITVVSETSNFLMSFFTWFIYYKGEFVWEQSMFLVARVLVVVSTLVVLYLGGDVIWVAVIALIVQFLLDIVNTIYSFVKLKVHFIFPKRPEFNKMLKDVLVFSIFLFLIIVVNQVNTNIGKTALGHLDSEDTHAVTVFGFGLQFFEYESIIASAVTTNFSPKVTRLAISHEDDQVKSYFLRVSNIQMVVLFMIVGGFATCGLDFVNAWLAKSELDSTSLTNIYYIALIVLAMWLIPFSETLGNEIQKAYNKHKFLAVVNLGFALVNIGITVGLLYLLPTEAKLFAPVIGMAVAVLGGNIITTNIYYKKNMNLPVGHFFAKFAIMLVMTAIDYGAVYVIYTYGIHLPEDMSKWVTTIIKGFSFLVFYLPMAALLYKEQLKGYLTNWKTAREAKKETKDKPSL